MDFGLQNNMMNLGNLNNGIVNNIPSSNTDNTVNTVNTVIAPVQEPVNTIQPQSIAPVQEPAVTQTNMSVELQQTPTTDVPTQTVVNNTEATPTEATPTEVTTTEVATESATESNSVNATQTFYSPKVKVEYLREFLHNISNTVRGRESTGTAGLVQIQFEYECLKLIASDGSYSIVQRDTTSKYPNIDEWDTQTYPSNFGIEVSNLTTLIDKLEDIYVTFTKKILDGNNKIIVSTDDGGSFLFDEKHDSDGSSLQIDIHDELENAPAIKIENPGEFKSLMNMSLTFVKDLRSDNPLKGVCFSEGKIISTDQGSMIIAKLPAEIAHLQTYLSADVIETICKVSFGPDLRIGLCENPVKNPTISKCLVIRGANISILVPCMADDLYTAYPKDALVAVANTTSEIKLKVDPVQLYNKIDIVCLFNQIGVVPRDVVRFDINGAEIQLSSFYRGGKMKILTKEGQANIQNLLFDKKALLNIIQKANAGDLEIGIVTANGSKLKVAYGDIVACIAVTNV